jgi:hypothetical protein
MINDVMSSELEHKAAPESVSRNCGFELSYGMKNSMRDEIRMRHYSDKNKAADGKTTSGSFHSRYGATPPCASTP